MQTHKDSDIPEGEWLDTIRQRAEVMTIRKENVITAGRPGEEALYENQVGMIFVRRLPDDPLALRISIGEGPRVSESAYCVFRGDANDVIELIERALAAMRAAF